MNALLAGYGEIGQAVYNLFSEKHNIDIIDTFKNIDKIENEYYDVLLVAFPFTDNFVENVQYYKNIYNIKDTIIFSTVQIGTTLQIEDAVHCPIEGRHPNLDESLKLWDFYLGGCSIKAIEFISQVKNISTVYMDSRVTELMKLQSTLVYGLNICFADFTSQLCKEYMIGYSEINDYNKSYNKLYASLGQENIKRYILEPPEGKIGGHCILRNAEILHKKHRSLFTKMVKDMQKISELKWRIPDDRNNTSKEE
jgi:hypothetical protein